MPERFIKNTNERKKQGKIALEKKFFVRRATRQRERANCGQNATFDAIYTIKSY
jgi:hypothetical protein